MEGEEKGGEDKNERQSRRARRLMGRQIEGERWRK